jgi:hypothetical protein
MEAPKIGGNGERYLFVRTKTGKKIHLASAGSSVCRCGHWLKTSSRNREVSPQRVESQHLCENCWTPATQTDAKAWTR